MPRKVKLSKRPEYVALEIMEIGKAVTPSEIDKHVGVGKYSSKYISFLKRDGYTIQTNKDGRNVVSYTLMAKPAETPVAGLERKPKEKAPKLAMAAKAKKPKAEKQTKAEKPVAKTKAPKSTSGFVLPSKKKSSKAEKPVAEEFADNQTMTSYSIDSDWDSMDNIDIKDLA